MLAFGAGFYELFSLAAPGLLVYSQKVVAVAGWLSLFIHFD